MYRTQYFNRSSFEQEWIDPDLAWAYSQYTFSEVLLPYNYIWLPNLTVNNA